MRKVELSKSRGLPVGVCGARRENGLALSRELRNSDVIDSQYRRLLVAHCCREWSEAFFEG